MESQQNEDIIKIGVSDKPENRAKQVARSHGYAKYAPYTVARKFHFTSKKEALHMESVLLQTVGIDEENYYNSFVGGCPELRYGGIKSVDAILSASNIEKIWACFWASKNSFIGCISVRDAVALEINSFLKPQLIDEIHEFEKNYTEAFKLLKCLSSPAHSCTILDSDCDNVIKTAKARLKEIQNASIALSQLTSFRSK
ncbi:hypothetical protein GCAAIG_10585 [Candidatus Electronema halotolerans]